MKTIDAETYIKNRMPEGHPIGDVTEWTFDCAMCGATTFGEDLFCIVDKSNEQDFGGLAITDGGPVCKGCNEKACKMDVSLEAYVDAARASAKKDYFEKLAMIEGFKAKHKSDSPSCLRIKHEDYLPWVRALRRTGPELASQ